MKKQESDTEEPSSAGPDVHRGGFITGFSKTGDYLPGEKPPATCSPAAAGPSRAGPGTLSCCWRKFSKQICLWNLVQGIGILFIIQIVGAICFFVATT